MIGNRRASPLLRVWPQFGRALASPTCVANLASAYVVSGSKNEAAKLLSDLKTRAKPSYSYATEIAVVYAALGDRDQAMNWLRKDTRGDLTRAFSCDRASIRCAPIRGSRSCTSH